MKLRRTLRILALAAIGAASVVPARADATDPFRTSFEMSFYAFDWCGDGKTGALYRRAILDKLDRCPSPAGAKERFHSWADGEAKQANQAIQSYLAEHDGKLPERLEGMKQSCADSLQAAESTGFRALLERYGHGEIPVDAVIPADCSAKGGQQ